VENNQKSVPENIQYLLTENPYIDVENDENDCRALDVDNPYNFSYYKETDIFEVAKSFKHIEKDTEFIANIIKFVVEQECPIHFELLCKRVAALFGNQKATVKVRNSVDYILKKRIKDTVIKNGDFCWHKEVTDIKVKIPEPYGNGRNINYISIEELAEAMFIITRKSFGITQNDLCTLTARAFGFNRTGGNITAALEKACLYLIESGKVKEVDGKIILH